MTTPSSAAELAAPRSFGERWAFPILLVGVIWTAFSPILVRLSEVGPVATGALRMAGALPIYLMLMAMSAKPHPRTANERARAIRFMLLSGVLFAGDVILWNSSVVLTSVANASLLANLTPIFVAIATWLFLGERVRRSFAFGMMIALAGSAVMMMQSYSVSSRSFLGDMLAVCASGFYGGYVVTTSLARRHASVTMTMVVSTTICAAILLAAAFVMEGTVFPQSLRGWMVILAMVLLIQIGGQTLIAMSLAHVSANLTALMFLIQPMIPATVAWIMFGERITLAQIAGAVCVLAGLEVARRSARTS
jgi:drug/metabolite transporter (DMT)-like permease